MSVVYHHSGKVSSIGAIFYLLLGFGSCLVISSFYGLVVWWLHKSGGGILFSIIPLLCAGGLYGMLLGYLGKLGKVRSLGFMLKTNFGFGLLFVYVSWVTTLWLLDSELGILPSPITVVEAARELSREGLWSMFGWRPTGAILISIWILEALVILVSTILISLYRLSEDVFCEQTGSWADEKLVIEPFDPVEDIFTFRSSVLEGDFSPILELKQSDRTRYHYAAAELVGFSKNPDFKLITIKNVQKNLDPDNTNAPDEDVVVQNVITTPEINKLLTDLWIKQPAAEKRLNKVSSD